MNQKELTSFVKEVACWNKAEDIPPEYIDDKVQIVPAPASDIWSLGALLKKLLNIPILVGSGVRYSPQLIGLRDLMLNSDPQKRPTVDYIISYLFGKLTLLYSDHPATIEPKSVPIKSKGIIRGITGGLGSLLNRSKSRYLKK